MTREHTFSRSRVDAWFARLAASLADQPLPTSTGAYRTADADEFMLMHVDCNDLGDAYPRAAFKHRDTRNYLVLATTPRGLRLELPTGGPWCRGVFDSGLPEVAA